jgi:CheY-like chemotaxis protein
MQGGQIAAYSEGRNHGAEFVITLPITNATSDTAAPFTPRTTRPTATDTPVAPVRSHDRKRILLVEDHAPTRSTLEFLLARRNYDVTTAGTFAEAQAAARNRAPELLLADLGLPDGGGWALLGELRKCVPDLPAIAISGFGMDEDLMRSRDAGFVAHLVKPIGIESLEAAIVRALAERRDTNVGET